MTDNLRVNDKLKVDEDNKNVGLSQSTDVN